MSIVSKPRLEEILSAVRQDVQRRRLEKTLRQQMTLAGRRKDYRDFGMALRRPRRAEEKLRWIGEVKKAILRRIGDKK